MLGVACSTHALHDGYTDLIYVMLPIWQAEFGLGYAELGILRSTFTGAMAAFQIPSGFLGELWPAGVLAAGTVLVGLGFMAAGLSGGLTVLFLALLVGGLGSSTQHPIGSALVARAYSGARGLKALGTYNFAGDVGKMILPSLGTLLIAATSWRSALVGLGAVGIVVGAGIIVLARGAQTRGERHDAPQEGAQPQHGFWQLLLIAVIDNATRAGFLLFLPFLLAQKGASLPTIGLALTLTFAGGAVGKLAMAWLGARLGVVATVCMTEVATTVLILAVLLLPLAPTLAILPLAGLALNGTSSVLYGSVPRFVTGRNRARAFGVFYTGSIGASASAAPLYGMLGDAIGIRSAVIVIALALLATLPLVLGMRQAFRTEAV